MLGACLVAAFAVARLTSGAYTAIMVTAAIGTVVVTALRRSATVAVTLGVLAVAASALWWGVRSATGSWAPTSRGLGSLHHSLAGARGILGGFHLPLTHTPGLLALGALAGGLSAVGSRGLGIRSPTLSLVPPAVLMVWSAAVLPSTGAAVGGMALGVCGFLVSWNGILVQKGAALVVVALSLLLAAVALSWTAEAGSVIAPHSQAGAEVAPSAASLATDLTGVETRDARLVLFRARTSVATYWQVTSLTTFSGGRWQPDPATSALLEGSAPTEVTATPPSPSTFTTVVTLHSYSGRLLPAPPATVLASGSPAPVVTPSGVVATSSYTSGSTYTARAVVPSPVTEAGGTEPAATAADDDTYTGPLPAYVQDLALAVTGGQTTELDKAEALVDFFRSGRFHYQVDTTQPTDNDPLVTFLTRTRTGSCEQFAGAFALLARASGLPTRVAIGFTPGRSSHGVTEVRGSDAHAWPQVLIGGSWVSFEPTPNLPSGELSPPGVLGPAALGRPEPTTPVTRPPVSIPTPTVPVTTPPPVPRSGSGSTPAAGTGILADLLIALGVVALASGAVALVLWRRRRRTPVDLVVGTWRSIDRALTRRHLARPPWRTPTGQVRYLATEPGNEQARATVEDLWSVATVIEQATYGTAPVTAEQADRAVQAGRRGRRAVLAGALSGAATAGTDDSGGAGVDSRVHSSH